MNPILYGADNEENIVSAFQISEKNIRVYKKNNKKVSFEDKEFYPFFFLSDNRYLDEFNRKHWEKKLNGQGHYKFACAFTNWSEMKEAYHFIIEKYKRENNGEVKDFNAVLLKNDPIGQYLAQYGKTLFKGMNFKDIYRVQFDIHIKKKDTGEKGEIFGFCLTDSTGWNKFICGDDKTEKQKIEEFIQTIKEKDPDIIEGYGLYNRLMSLLMEKCKLLNIPLTLGRNDLEVRYIERISISEYEFEKPVLVVPGRHLIDIIDVVQNYDHIKRNLDSYSLENIAKIVLEENGEKLQGKSKEFPTKEKDDDKFKQSLLNNCLNIQKISNRLLPGLFYLCQIIPFNLGRIVKLSHYQKIEAVILREYLKERQAIPAPEKIDMSHSLGSEIFFTGVLGPIVHSEIDLLGPMAMLKNSLFPKSDSLGVFKKILEDLIKDFNDSMSQQESEENNDKKSDLDYSLSLSKSFLNAFFGYIGSPKTLFNSNEISKKVLGQIKEMIEKIVAIIKNSGGICVTIDSEEIYFIPPRDVVNEEMEKNYIGILGKKLSDVAILRYKERFRRMFSYKKKNYAFLSYNNKIRIKGSSLISKNIERFGRRFIYQCIDFLLNHRIEEVHKLYNKFHKEITEKTWDITEFQRTETLRESLKDYERSVNQGRAKSPYYQLAIASGKGFKPGDSISFYVINEEAVSKRNKIDYETASLVKSISTESEQPIEKKNPFDGCENYKLAEEWNPNFRDESIEYYLQRLDEIAQKFQSFFTPEDFRMVFSPDDLFIYSSSNIKILSRELPPEEKEEPVKENPVQQS